jgi:UDP-N-acetylglucosamine 2-epimerase (non-hydrolysing)
MLEVFSALKRLADCFANIEIIYPVHLYPSVFYAAHKYLSNVHGIHLMRPFTYGETYWILKNCYAVLTDSGGIQEEAPAFQKPVLVLRNTTERIEWIKAGVAKLVGVDADNIFVETKKLLKSTERYNRVGAESNLYGDGYSSERVVKILRKKIFLEIIVALIDSVDWLVEPFLFHVRTNY